MRQRKTTRKSRPETTEQTCALDLARSLFPPGKPVKVKRDGCAKRGYVLTEHAAAQFYPPGVVVEEPPGRILVRYSCMGRGHFHVAPLDDITPA